MFSKRLWEGIGARGFAVLGATACRLPDLLVEFRGEFDDIAAGDGVAADLQLGAELVELALALFELLDRFVDHVAGVRVAARGDELLDLGFDLG
jgi:hypothetical protein